MGAPSTRNVVPVALRADLEELLAARYFLRHAYGLELDPQKLASQAASLRAVAIPLRQSLDVFVAFLTKAIDATAGA